MSREDPEIQRDLIHELDVKRKIERERDRSIHLALLSGVCPDCGNGLRPEGGCEHCPCCGFNKC